MLISPVVVTLVNVGVSDTATLNTLPFLWVNLIFLPASSVNLSIFVAVD